MSDFGIPTFGPNGLVYFQGLSSQLQTDQIIQALLTPYTEQVNAIQAQQKSYSSLVTNWQSVNSDVTSLQNAANALKMASSWQAVSATSSNTSVATATAATGTPQGTVSFTVNSLASSDSWVSSGTVASTGSVITASTGYLLSQASQYGFTNLAGSGLTIGAHTLDVTQAISAASTTGTSLLAPSVTIGAGNNTINVTVNGTAKTLTLASGTYTQSQLASEINTEANAAGIGPANGLAGMTASVSAGGYLVLATNQEGSGSSLQVTGGSALASLGLSTMASAAVGSAGSVTVDGTVNTFDNKLAGSTVVLTSGTGGTITATLGTGVGNMNGTFTATNVSTGTGSLADVVSAINTAATGIVAAAVKNTSGQYVLQLSSTQTGTNSTITSDANAFSSSGLGVMKHTQVASNAIVTVGGAYSVSSQSNTVTGLMSGLSVNVLSTSPTPVTITVSTDTKNLTKLVQDLVDAANKALADLNKLGGYNSTTKTAGPLMGQAAVSELTQAILGTFATTLGTSGLSSGMVAGISVVYSSSTGQTTVVFDQAKFQAELASNPAAVQGLFAQGGTYAWNAGYTGTGTVSLVAATNSTRPGTFAVNITTPAAQAVDKGAVLGGGKVTAAETLTFKQGTTTVNYTTTANESLSAVAAGLNAQFATAGVDLVAQVINGGTQLQVNTQGYGSTATFTVSTTNGAAGTTGLAGSFTGTNVAGTINGIAATGSGQFLTASTTDPIAAGLTLQVTADKAGSGKFTYSPGIGQAIASVADRFSNSSNGILTTTITGLNNASSNLDSQVTFYQNLAATEKASLKTEFAMLEATLGALHNQRSYLQTALSQGI